MLIEKYHVRFRRPALVAFAVSWCAALILPTSAQGPAALPPVAAQPRFRASASARIELPEHPGNLIAAATPPTLPETIRSMDMPADTGLFAATGEPTLRDDAPAQYAKASVSQSVTINLINRLVERGVLTKDDSSDLLKQAEADAADARAQAEAQQQAAIQVAVAQAMATVQQNPQAFSPDAQLYAAAAAEDAVRVTYIPENVKAQIRDELREEVMAKAREEKWAAPRMLPEWTTRIRLFGDVRVRYEKDFFPSGNDNTGAFPNFNAINTGAPFDVTGTQFSPQLNVDEDRQRLRLRVRFGAEADLGNGFSAGLRIATGENNSPTSTNQSFGLANQGQGGNFSKYAIWLDRGFLKYEAGQPNKNIALTLGRFDNPFFSTSEIIWDDDLGFDGAALQAKYEVLRGFTPFIAGGAFPVFNTDFNFATNQPSKFESTDKWLYGAQFGVDWKIHKDFNLKTSVAYYYFDGVQGRVSDPFVPLTSSDQGNTDNTRPSFAQKGNTYRPLRNIIPTVDNDFGTSRQFQYFGLASDFRELAVNGRFDINRWEPFQISFIGEWVKNLALDRSAVDLIAVNNRGANNALGRVGGFAGGDTGWIVGAKVGSATMQKRWDWQAGVNYRYVESDAVLDAFSDSDFGLGGTNLKGFTVFGALALSPRISLGVRWMSADEVAGPPFRNDILQVDVNGKF